MVRGPQCTEYLRYRLFLKATEHWKKGRKGQSLPLTDITCFQTTSFHIFTCIHLAPIFSSSAYVKLQWDICQCKPRNVSVTCFPIVSYLDQIQHCYIHPTAAIFLIQWTKTSSKKACLAQTGKFLRVKVFDSTNNNSDCRFCMCYWCKMQHWELHTEKLLLIENDRCTRKQWSYTSEKVRVGTVI